MSAVTQPICPTCGPTQTEPHPRTPVERCQNCKEHLRPRQGDGLREAIAAAIADNTGLARLAEHAADAVMAVVQQHLEAAERELLAIRLPDLIQEAETERQCQRAERAEAECAQLRDINSRLLHDIETTNADVAHYRANWERVTADERLQRERAERAENRVAYWMGRADEYQRLYHETTGGDER
jgi:hypothetical protein